MGEKVRSVAAINATPDQKAMRNIGRIKTLRTAIQKAESRGQKDRVKSLNAELSRRMGEVEALKAALEEI